MTIRFRLVLGLAAMIIALSLVGGTAGHQAVSTTAHSPYVSALANVSVATAEAANPHRCQNRSCGSLQGIKTCTEDTFGTNCAVSFGVCTQTACP
jgi:hypothetical protein